MIPFYSVILVNKYDMQYLHVTILKTVLLPLLTMMCTLTVRHQASETSDVTTTSNSGLMHPRNTILGRSLYDLGQGTGNEVFYALACSYSMFYSSIV